MSRLTTGGKKVLSYVFHGSVREDQRDLLGDPGASPETLKRQEDAQKARMDISNQNQLNQGLQLPTPLPDATSFTLVMDFSLDVISGYRKIVDFQSLGPDSGFYNYYGNLNFYPITTSSTSVISAGQNVQVVLTRDSIISLVTGYVNGVQAISFTDSGNLSVFSSSANGLYFFKDDFATGQGEASGGLVSRILIFENPLTSAEVLALAQSQLPLSIPEPSTVWLVLIGAGVIVVSVCRRNRRE